MRGMRLVCENEKKGRENYKKYERVGGNECVSIIKEKRHMSCLSVQKNDSQRIIINKSCEN